MIAALLFCGLALLFLYFYLDNKRTHWARRGIPGPPGGLLFGNLFEVWFAKIPRVLVLTEWTKKYGKVYGFREGQRNIMVISDLEMSNEILMKKFELFSTRMPFPLHRSGDDPKTPLPDASGAKWKRLRTLGSFGFTNGVLKKIRPTVENTAMMVVEHLEKQVGEVNVLRVFQEYTMDIICKVALGKKDVEMFSNNNVDTCIEIFNSRFNNYMHGTGAALPFLNKPALAVLDFLGTKTNLPFAILVKDLEKAVTARKLERETEAEPESIDFIDIYLDAEVDETSEKIQGSRKMVLEEVVMQCLIMLLAGFDTTANSLSYATHLLANHPEVQDKMREEIERVCPGESVEYECLAQLEYVHAVMREALRHYPLASFVVARECLQATDVGGYPIQKGDCIMTDTWSMHMDKAIWGQDADKFRPERWLEPSDRPRYAFQSFGEGPRGCIGVRLATMEEKIMLVHLVKNFRIHTTENTNPLRLIGDLTVSPEKVLVRLERI